ncbi:hypothetical protein HK097_005129, partial [Rhizophlyctis rosea]
MVTNYLRHHHPTLRTRPSPYLEYLTTTSPIPGHVLLTSIIRLCPKTAHLPYLHNKSMHHNDSPQTVHTISHPIDERNWPPWPPGCATKNLSLEITDASVGPGRWAWLSSFHLMIQFLERLETLSVGSIYMDKVTIPPTHLHLSALKNLTSLQLDTYIHITDIRKFCDALKTSTRLKHLKITGLHARPASRRLLPSEVDEYYLSNWLSNFPNLETLEGIGGHLTSAFYATIPPLQNLTHLRLDYPTPTHTLTSFCEFVTYLQTYPLALPSLAHLDLLFLGVTVPQERDSAACHFKK